MCNRSIHLPINYIKFYDNNLFILQPSLQNSVTYVYDGKKLTGIVNNVVQQTALTGNAYVVRGLNSRSTTHEATTLTIAQPMWLE